jgi:hypothetical protein
MACPLSSLRDDARFQAEEERDGDRDRVGSESVSTVKKSTAGRGSFLVTPTAFLDRCRRLVARRLGLRSLAGWSHASSFGGRR